jgi:DNA polymerase III psi subunit
MPEENFILSKDFIDFEIFAISDGLADDFEHKNAQALSTLVVFNEAEKKDDLLELLHNILSAAKLSVDKQVHTLSVTRNNAYSFIQMQSKAGFEKALLFGVTPADLGIHLDLHLYQPLPFQGCNFVLADKLADIQQDTNKKKALWSCLKDIYL